MTLLITLLVIAYLIGSIPTAIWYGRMFHKTDIRNHGSGNAGATNTLRTFGKTAGILVLLFDIAKGSLCVILPIIVETILHKSIPANDYFLYPELMLGIAGALGHIYPIYEKFKGGKGVATLFGVIIALQPVVALFTALIFVLIFIISKRVSLGSILASIGFAIIFILRQELTMPIDIGLTMVYPILIIYTHRSNIGRLLKGEEPKLQLGKKK